MGLWGAFAHYFISAGWPTIGPITSLKPTAISLRSILQLAARIAAERHLHQLAERGATVIEAASALWPDAFDLTRSPRD